MRKFLPVICLLFVHSSGFAIELNIFGISIGNPCPNGANAIVRNNGKLTVCGAGGNTIIQAETGKDGSTKTFFASGGSADNISKAQLINAETKAKQRLQKFLTGAASQSVYPVLSIENNEPDILGTAFRYGEVFLTALHVVKDSTDKKLFIFDAQSNRLKEITGYAPLYRDSKEDLTYYDDFCALEIERQSPSALTSLPAVNPLNNFNYVELSYPIGKNSIVEPTITSSHSSHPDTSSQHLIILNRSGQDFLSSGGAVFNLDDKDSLAAMSICIDESNAVRSINLNRLNDNVRKALKQGFLSDLTRLKFNFKFLGECNPIGGRRGGG